MDKVLKRKIRRLWRHRFLLGAGALALIGCSLLQLQTLLEHRPRQPPWVLELSNSVELVADQNNPANARKQALSEILSIAQARNLSVTEILVRELELERALELKRALELTQALERELERELELRLERALARELMIELARELELRLEQALELEQALVRALGRKPEGALAGGQDPELALAQELTEGITWEPELEQALVLRLMLRLEQGLEPELEPELERALMREPALERALVLAGPRENLVITVTAELEHIYGLTIQHGETLDSLLDNEPRRTRMFLQAGVLLGLSGVTLMVFLGMLIRLNRRYTFPATTHFVAFLPEECVAELDVLQKRMKKANASLWQIRFRLLEEFMTLLWVFYIQVQLENLTLPRRDREIDD